MFSRLATILTLGLLLGGIAAAQVSPTPSPTPSPYAVDSNGIPPEKVGPVPPIAPLYKSDERDIPELGRAGVDMAALKPLSLNDAILLALENNRDIEVSRKNVRIAEFDLLAARGVYEPRFVGQVYYDRSTVPNVSIFSNIPTTTQGTIVGNSSLTAFIPNFGTQVAATFNNQRVTTDNPISPLSPQFNSGLGFSITQPLFRGRSIDPQRRTIEIAKRNLSLTDAQFRQRSIEIVAAVEKSYWDLAYTLRNLQVQREGLADAKAQLEHNRRLVNEGSLAPVDIIAAETQVANYEGAVYDALNLVNVAENALKSLMSPNRRDDLWSQAITPIEPVTVNVPQTSVEAATAAALLNRPELDLNKIQKDINEVDRDFYNSQRKPQIDFVGSYNSAGIGGVENPNFASPFCITSPNPAQCNAALIQPILQNIGSPGSAYSDIFKNKYPTYRFGIQFSLPIFGDKTSRAQYGRALVEGERIETQRDAIEQQIQVEVRNALQLVKTTEARLRSAAIARENTAKQYESERRKYDEGQTDVYRVLERQTAFTSARSNELRAQTELNKAIVDLERATGNSLKANNVEPVKK